MPDPKQGIGVWPYAALAAGQGADVWSTHEALKRGGREANPILGQSIGEIAAAKAGVSVGIALAMRSMAKQHPKLAKTMGYMTGSIGALAAMHNLRVK